ncbi:MAG: AzlD domain-containing protein [Paracoccaceae bacterium]
MSGGLLLMAVLAGSANCAFRYLPVRASGAERMPGGGLGRFLAATGPAAIATLFVASLVPSLRPRAQDPLPLAAGISAVLGAFGLTRSVGGATLFGAVAYGVAFGLLRG